SSRRRHTRSDRDWSSDVCSSDLVCIIGSGAAGSVMAKELCEGGAKVILLEAGREVPLTKFLSHKWPYELPYRGFRGEKQAPFYQGRSEERRVGVECRGWEGTESHLYH